MKNILICDARKPKEVVGLCREYGIGIELQSFYHPYAIGDSNLRKDILSLTYGISIKTIHGAFIDLCAGSPDKEVLNVTRKRFEQSWSLLKQFDATHIVFHHGFIPHMSWPSEWLRLWSGFWNDFLRDKDNNIRVHMENHLDPEPTLISEAIDLLEYENVDINLDIGHANFASNIPIIKWIETLGKKIGYVHLHDNHGDEDEHLGLGQGTMPMIDICEALEEYAPDCTWAIEAIEEGIKQSLEWLSKYGYLS